VALGEEFGETSGENTMGRLVAALRHLGFAEVYDTSAGADLTVLEEAAELQARLESGKNLPLFTSCCPAWVEAMHQRYPEMAGHLSSCKSPMSMLGAVIKAHHKSTQTVDGKRTMVVAIMPCTAKKAEAANGVQDVDFVLTTRELGRMIKESGIDFAALPAEEYDAPFGISTGAGVIFGSSGGVMEAALRTVAEVVTGKTLESIDFKEVRGLAGIKEAAVPIGDLTVKIAVANTLSNARIMMDKIRAGEADYQFIEIMACPGGCIGGGGQPVPVCEETRLNRIAAIYECDQGSQLRKSHENPAIKELYDTWLGKPLGEKSHHLLHTHYKAQIRC